MFAFACPAAVVEFQYPYQPTADQTLPPNIRSIVKRVIKCTLPPYSPLQKKKKNRNEGKRGLEAAAL